MPALASSIMQRLAQAVCHNLICNFNTSLVIYLDNYGSTHLSFELYHQQCQVSPSASIVPAVEHAEKKKEKENDKEEGEEEEKRRRRHAIILWGVLTDALPVGSNVTSESKVKT
jgi:hypothetical protein